MAPIIWLKALPRARNSSRPKFSGILSEKLRRATLWTPEAARAFVNEVLPVVRYLFLGERLVEPLEVARIDWRIGGDDDHDGAVTGQADHRSVGHRRRGTKCRRLVDHARVGVNEQRRPDAGVIQPGQRVPEPAGLKCDVEPALLPRAPKRGLHRPSVRSGVSKRQWYRTRPSLASFRRNGGSAARYLASPRSGAGIVTPA